jgi:hypothetical protein
MEEDVKKREKLKLFVTQFLLPQPIDLVSYFFIGLLALVIASNRTLLVILSDGTPVSDTAFSSVFGEQIGSLNQLLAIPILGRVVLFIFWLAIGSIVYMAVWLFQNLAVEVYDDIAVAKLKGTAQAADEVEPEESWWGTTLAHTLFIGSSVILFLFFLIIVVNALFPAWVQLFQIGLQSLSQITSILALLISLVGIIITIHGFVLFWRLFFRLKSFLYNSF